MMGKIESKLPGVQETIFTSMSQLARKHKAINLGQGFPDFDMDPNLISLVYEAMKSGHNQYAHQSGLLTLREAISNKIKFLYQTDVDPNTEICITPGGTYAIYTALTSLLCTGDEAIVLEPAFDSYIPNIEINGAKPILIPLSFPEYKVDWDRVRKAITPNTKFIILNSPNNPTGALLDREDIRQLSRILSEHDLYVLSDEVYEHCIFDGYFHESMLKYPEIFNRSFVIFSFGKVYNCTGWKIGYCVAPKVLMDEFNKVHQFNAFACNTPFQYGIAEFLKNKSAYLNLGKMLQERRDLLQRLLENTGLKAIPSHGSFFQLYDYSAVSEKDELAFAQELTEFAGVGTIPVSSFYANREQHQVLRFCFAKKESTLHEAGSRIKTYLNSKGL